MDEINLAPPSIQASLYQLILDRRIGDWVCPDGVSIVAAGNRISDMANVFPLSAPLKNRFGHATLMVPSEEEWREWALDHGVKTDIVAFMAFKQSMLFKLSKETKSNSFPTPRTWAMASHMTSHLSGKNNSELDEEFMLTSCCVGEGVALEYQAFVKLKSKIKISDLLQKPKLVNKFKDDIGIMYSIVSGLAEKYRGDRKLANKVLAVVDALENNELCVFCLRLMKAMHPGKFANDMTKCDNWPSVHKKAKNYVL